MLKYMQLNKSNSLSLRDCLSWFYVLDLLICTNIVHEPLKASYWLINSLSYLLK